MEPPVAADESKEDGEKGDEGEVSAHGDPFAGSADGEDSTKCERFFLADGDEEDEIIGAFLLSCDQTDFMALDIFTDKKSEDLRTQSHNSENRGEIHQQDTDGDYGCEVVDDGDCHSICSAELRHYLCGYDGDDDDDDDLATADCRHFHSFEENEEEEEEELTEVFLQEKLDGNINAVENELFSCQLTEVFLHEHLDGNINAVESEHFNCPEVLSQPSLVGKETSADEEELAEVFLQEQLDGNINAVENERFSCQLTEVFLPEHLDGNINAVESVHFSCPKVLSQPSFVGKETSVEEKRRMRRQRQRRRKREEKRKEREREEGSHRGEANSTALETAFRAVGLDEIQKMMMSNVKDDDSDLIGHEEFLKKMTHKILDCDKS